MSISELQEGSSFERYIREIRVIWGDGKDPALPFKVKALMEKMLLSVSPEEPWLAQLINEGAPSKELYRDPDYGFIQMGHVHKLGRGNPPHDHGPCWVVYGAYSGLTEIVTYRRIDDGGLPGRAILEKKEVHRLAKGVVYPYGVGEIHGVKVLEAPAVVFRFLSYDLNQVERYRYDLEAGTVQRA